MEAFWIVNNERIKVRLEVAMNDPSSLLISMAESECEPLEVKSFKITQLDRHGLEVFGFVENPKVKGTYQYNELNFSFQ